MLTYWCEIYQNYCYEPGKQKQSNLRIRLHAFRLSEVSPLLESHTDIKASLRPSLIIACLCSLVLLIFSFFAASQTSLLLHNAIMMWSSACWHVPDLPSLSLPLSSSTLAPENSRQPNSDRYPHPTEMSPKGHRLSSCLTSKHLRVQECWSQTGWLNCTHEAFKGAEYEPDV